MIAALLSLLGSSAVGSIIGGVLAHLNRKNDNEIRRLDLEHERLKWVHEKDLRMVDIEVAKAEAAGNFKVAQAEAQGQFDVARAQAISKIEDSDRITADDIKAAGSLGWLYVIASAYRRSIRPVVTTIMLGAVLWIDYTLLNEIFSNKEALTVEARTTMVADALSWIMGQAAVVISYWFVARGSSDK